jgi:hypothetical protein
MATRGWRVLLWRSPKGPRPRRSAARATLALELLEARDVPSATQFFLSGSQSVTAGTPFLVTVRAVDAAGTLDPTYTGTVRFFSSAPDNNLPAPYTFTAADAGQHTFVGQLNTAGAQSIIAQDTNDLGVMGTQQGIVVAPGPTTGFLIGAPGAATAGSSFAVTITAVDDYSNTTPGYLGRVHFTSTDPLATLPADYQFGPADGGQHTFAGFVFQTAGNQVVSAADVAVPSLTGGTPVSVTSTAPPGVQLGLNAAEVSVGDTVTLTGTLAQVSSLPVTVMLTWGDGSPATALHLAPGAQGFQAAHVYGGPSADYASGAFTIRAAAGNGTGPPLTGTAAVVVDTVAPDVAMADEFVQATVGEPATFSGQVSDPGGEPLSVAIDFGDGTDPQPLTLLPDGTFAVSHVFTGDDVYDVTVTVDDGVDVATADTLALVFLPGLQDSNSEVVAPGGQAATSAPGIVAQADHAATAAGPADLTVGRYDETPVTGPATALDGLSGVATYELRLAGAGAGDRLTVTFSYPGSAGSAVGLDFYDPATRTFRPVEGSLVAPGSLVIDEARHTITLVLDRTSFPRVTALHGTIFTVSVPVPQAVPAGDRSPVVGVAVVSAPAAPPAFLGGGRRTLTLSPSSDGGPSAGRANLSGEGRRVEVATTPDPAALASGVPDPWSLDADDPFARWVPEWGADVGAGLPRDEVPAAPESPWLLAPTGPVDPAPLTEPPSPQQQGSLRPTPRDDYWLRRTSPAGESAPRAVTAAALGLGLLHVPTRRATRDRAILRLPEVPPQ